ncbi:hypothetical protein [Streptomyces lincolnensis]|uniref:hypothetical protein n=1 Tax=Streptomyces lincolnensis TaxID=1915 RepID=UPI0037D694E1
MSHPVQSLADRQKLRRRAADRFGYRAPQPHPMDERLAAQSEAAYKAYADRRVPKAASLMVLVLSVRATVLGEVLLLENILATAREHNTVDPDVIVLLEDVVDAGHEHTIALADVVRSLAPTEPAGPATA